MCECGKWDSFSSLLSNLMIADVSGGEKGKTPEKFLS